ncbi:MAG: hypothetical protein U0599_09190 [Vicinamibacteria bacterium]
MAFARGFDHNDAVRSLSVLLTADTIFRIVHSSRHATRGHVTHSPGTAQALARLGGGLQGVLVRCRSSCGRQGRGRLLRDDPEDEMPAPLADAVEILACSPGRSSTC